MKPPEQVRLELVRQWLAKADEDFALAEYLIAGHAPFYGAIGFHAQQAAEKFIKALLVRFQVEFPKTHDLDQLIDLVAAFDSYLADALREASPLTQYSVEVRYPSESPQLTEEEAKNAVLLATHVRDAALGLLKDYLQGDEKEPKEP